MAMRHVLMISLIFSAFVSNPAHSKQNSGLLLWQTARAGMTISEIKSLFPEAKEVKASSTDEVGCLLQLENRLLLEKEVIIDFCFNSKGFEAVELHIDKGLERFPEQSFEFTKRVVMTLNNEFNQNAVCEIEPPIDMRDTAKISCDWNLKGKAIGLYYIHVFDRNALFVLNWKKERPKNLNAY